MIEGSFGEIHTANDVWKAHFVQPHDIDRLLHEESIVVDAIDADQGGRFVELRLEDSTVCVADTRAETAYDDSAVLISAWAREAFSDREVREHLWHMAIASLGALVAALHARRIVAQRVESLSLDVKARMEEFRP